MTAYQIQQPEKVTSIRGFTLIELLIVVAIVGILASIAIPQYSIYTVKARVSEGLVFARDAQTLVVDNAHQGYALDSGYVPVATTKNLNSLTINDTDGTITVFFTANVSLGKTLVFRPTVAGQPLAAGQFPAGPVDWNCDKIASSLQDYYRPVDCR